MMRIFFSFTLHFTYMGNLFDSAVLCDLVWLDFEQETRPKIPILVRYIPSFMGLQMEAWLQV